MKTALPCRELTIDEALQVREHIANAFDLAMRHLQGEPGAWQAMRFEMADALSMLNRVGIIPPRSEA